MQADVQADDIVFQRLRDCKAVCTASSEEQTDMLDMGGRDYSVSLVPMLWCKSLCACKGEPVQCRLPTTLWMAAAS